MHILPFVLNVKKVVKKITRKKWEKSWNELTMRRPIWMDGTSIWNHLNVSFTYCLKSGQLFNQLFICRVYSFIGCVCVFFCVRKCLGSAINITKMMEMHKHNKWQMINLKFIIIMSIKAKPISLYRFPSSASFRSLSFFYLNKDKRVIDGRS